MILSIHCSNVCPFQNKNFKFEVESITSQMYSTMQARDFYLFVEQEEGCIMWVSV